MEIITQKKITSNNTLYVGAVAPGHVALTGFKADALAISGTLGSTRLPFEITKQEELNEDMKNSPTAVAFQSLLLRDGLLRSGGDRKTSTCWLGNRFLWTTAPPELWCGCFRSRNTSVLFFFFFSVIIYTPEKARQTHGCGGKRGGGGQVKEAHRAGLISHCEGGL